MIRSVHLNYKSGIRLFSRSYPPITTNDDYFSGFLLALARFAGKMIQEDLQEIKMEQHTIIYDQHKPLLLVVAGHDFDRRLLKRALRQIYSDLGCHSATE